MENSIWNLMVKASSLIAVVLLVLGTGLVFAPYFGVTQNSTAALATILFFGTSIAVFALVASTVSNDRTGRALSDAASVAHRISQGELYDGDGGSEVHDSLRNVSDYIANKSAEARRIADGDLSEGIVPVSDSDVLGHAFANMVENLRALIQTQESRERLHNSVKKLLSEVSDVAAGDLTVQAEVGPEITGAIADAFNSMTHSLRSLIGQVKDITHKVGTSASAINETTEQLASGSLAQASQISRTTAAIADMVVQIQEVSENATLSTKVAGQSLNNARMGTRSAKENINAMNGIKRQVQETAKRIKKLGERSQEISQIVSLVSDLSDRTSLLALNASLQASAAGTAGSGFAIVAEEIESLAERSNRLTQQISDLTQTINVETKEVVASMEETIHEVIVGSALADKAGQSLVEIEQVSATLADLLQSISESAKVQAKGSADISSAMSGISEVTDLVQNGSKRAAESVRILVELSASLRSSVSPFKLPPNINPPSPRKNSVFVN